MLRIYPGYRIADGGVPVARAGALRRPREQSAAWPYFPDAMLRIYPGYRTAEGERIPRVAAYALPGLPQTTVSP